MDTNLKTAPKKDSNLTTLKMRRKKSKSKKLLLKDSANYAKKFLETKLRKFKSDKDFVNLLVHWSLESMDGQQTCRES
jgi:hypothetical protein